MTKQNVNLQSTGINVRVIGFILLYVASIFFVIGSAAANASSDQHGHWTEKQYQIKGDWSIGTSNGQTVIRFGKSFKTKKGPDLKIFLSSESLDSLNGKNAVNKAVLVAELKSNRGAQEYALPANLNINDFESLIIHCEAYSVLWGGASI